MKFPWGFSGDARGGGARFKVPKMLATTEAGTFVEYLTKPRTLLKFFNRFVRQQKSDIIDDDGNVIQKSGETYNEDKGAAVPVAVPLTMFFAGLRCLSHQRIVRRRRLARRDMRRSRGRSNRTTARAQCGGHTLAWRHRFRQRTASGRAPRQRYLSNRRRQRTRIARSGLPTADDF